MDIIFAENAVDRELENVSRVLVSNGQRRLAYFSAERVEVSCSTDKDLWCEDDRHHLLERRLDDDFSTRSVDHGLLGHLRLMISEFAGSLFASLEVFLVVTVSRAGL